VSISTKSALTLVTATNYKNRLLNSKFGIQFWNPHLEFVSTLIIERRKYSSNEKIRWHKNKSRNNNKKEAFDNDGGSGRILGMRSQQKLERRIHVDI
jgi:hypothetical protein